MYMYELSTIVMVTQCFLYNSNNKCISQYVDDMILLVALRAIKRSRNLKKEKRKNKVKWE